MTGWASETLIASAVLIAAVLLLRAPVARLFGARAAYALWLAPLLRMLVPPLPDGSPLPEFAIFTAEPGSGSAALALSGGLALETVLMWLWLGGAAVFLLFHAAVHRRFLARALAAGRRVDSADVAGAELIESSAVAGPIATGVFRPRILIPASFDQRLSNEQRRLALAHEDLHHRRGDLIALALSLVVLALHWFNPLAHLAHRMFRRDLEAACDAELIERLGPGERQDYARAIVGCASRPVPRAICTLTTIDDLKRRLTMLQWNHGASARLTGFGCAALLAAGGLTLGTELRAQASDAPEERIEIHKVVRDGKATPEFSAERRMQLEQCLGEKIEAAAAGATGDKKQQTRIVLCGKKDASNAELVQMLEKAVARIESENDLRGDNKAQIVEKLRSKIAELRAR